MDVAFYSMASEVYFPGAVGLVNSLRLAGHDEPIVLLDCGLRPRHRELLAPHVTLVDAPVDAPPFLLKTVAPGLRPAEVSVLIDADMVVTRSLTPLIAEGTRGRVVAFENDVDRFVPQWGELLGLGPVRRRRYVSSGLVILGGAVGREVLDLLDDRRRRVDFARSYFGAHPSPDYPFLYLDQDVLNAILATRVDPQRALTVEHRLAPNPPYRGVRVVDEKALRCAYPDGTRPFLLHQYVRKPWLEPTLETVYSRLLRRLLTGSDVAIELPPDEVPPPLRGGMRGRVARASGATRHYLRWNLPALLPGRARSRIDAALGRRAARGA